MKREHKHNKYLALAIGVSMAVMAMAVLVLAGRNVIADPSSEEGYHAGTRAERKGMGKFDLAKGVKEPEEFIQEYLEAAKRAFAEQDIAGARKYADKVLDLEANNRQAQFLIVKIEELEKTAPDIIALRMEQARAIAGEINGVKRAETAEEKEKANLARQKTERIAGYMEEAEDSIRSSDMSNARMYVEKALEVDPGHEDAISMLDSIKRAEEEYRAELEKARQAQKKDIVTRYLERARENLESDKFDRARSYTMRALEVENGKAEARDMLAEIDQAEGLYRQRHSIEEETPAMAREARRLGAHKERQAARRRREISRIREHISRARRHLVAGEYGRARNSAYQAWKIVPYDTEVAVLIADINREDLLASSSAELSTEEDVITNPEMTPSIDPLQKHEERKSIFDMVNYAIPELFGRRTFALGELDTTRIMTLEDCVREAVRGNPQIRMADEQVKLAEMILWETRRKLFPEATLRMERSFGKIGDPEAGGVADAGATRHYQGRKYKADIKQNIFDGFGQWYETRQKQTNLEIIKLEGDKIRNEVVEETEKAYYMLDKALKSVEIQKMISSNTARLNDVMEKAYQQEIVPRVDYLKVKAYDMQAQFQYVSAREDVNLAEMVLLQAMDMDPDDSIMIQPVERPEKFLLIGLQNCYNLALANNPDFKIKQKTIEFYDFERKMSKAKGWPKVDFEGSFGKAMEAYQPMRSDSDIDGGNPNRADRGLEPEWYAGVRASLPVWGSTLEYNYVREFWASSVSTFRGTESATSYFNLKILDDLAYYTGIQSAKVGFERAKYEYIKARQDLAVEIKELYFRYRKALLQMNVAEAQVEYQRTFIEVLEERRRSGEMDMPKLAEEYIRLAEDEYGTVHSDSEYYLSISSLNRAIGVSDYLDPMGKKRDRWEKREEGESGDIDYIPKRDREKIDELLHKGEEALKRRKFSQARNLAERASRIGADTGEIRRFLGAVDQAEGMGRDNQSGGR